jgi:hypothetical protein
LNNGRLAIVDDHLRITHAREYYHYWRTMREEARFFYALSCCVALFLVLIQSADAYKIFRATSTPFHSLFSPPSFRDAVKFSLRICTDAHPIQSTVFHKKNNSCPIRLQYSSLRIMIQDAFASLDFESILGVTSVTDEQTSSASIPCSSLTSCSSDDEDFSVLVDHEHQYGGGTSFWCVVA